jgi:peptide deformylase
MILKVARIGHPVIRARAREVAADELRSEAFQRLLDDMVETMHEYDGVGLAGPQVHVGLRVAVLEVPSSDERARAPVPLLALVNLDRMEDMRSLSFLREFARFHGDQGTDEDDDD